MKRLPTLEPLRGLPLFRGCSERDLRRIDGLTYFQEVPAETVLCRQGRFGRETFVIVSGQAAVTIDGALVATLGRGDVVGEMAVLEGARRTATMTAVTPLEVLVLSPTELETMLAEVPCVARRMLATLSTRLRLANPAPVEPAGWVDAAGGANPRQMVAVCEDRR